MTVLSRGSRVASSGQSRGRWRCYEVEADPAALVGTLLGGEALAIDVPASCGGDPKICCSGGTPDPICGPVIIDLALQALDEPRLEVQPVQGQQRVDIVIRARLATTTPIPITYLGIGCDIDIDTAPGATEDMVVTIEIALPQDPDEATTRMDVVSSDVAIEDEDISIGGNIICTGADALIKGVIIDLLSDAINGAVADTLSGQSCVACDSGTTQECGAFADSCEDNICMIGSRCEQRIGLSGRMPVASLFGGSSNGQLGSMDLFDVAGGYTETDDEGVSMGMYSGALSPPVFVDDGVREGDSRAHPVGASAAIVVDGDRFPAIVYQDGLLANVEIARFEQGSWQRSTFKEGARVDGFFVAAAADGASLWMSHYFYETTSVGPGELEIDTLIP